MVGGYADLMQQFGLADSMQAMYVTKQTDAAVAEISAGNFAPAFEVAIEICTPVHVCILMLITLSIR